MLFLRYAHPPPLQLFDVYDILTFTPYNILYSVNIVGCSGAFVVTFCDHSCSKLEEAINQKSVVERELFELNEENRLLKHECLKSVEDKKIAEALIGTVRDQMKRSEEKLTKLVKHFQLEFFDWFKINLQRSQQRNKL